MASAEPESDHANLLASDELTEEEKARAKLDLADLGEDGEGEDMETAETSPIIKTSQNGNPHFRFTIVFVTLYPGKQIHYGRLLPVHPKVFRTFCRFFPQFYSDGDMFATPLLPSGRFPSAFEPTQDYWDYLQFLLEDPPFLSRCPHIRIHLDSRRAISEPTNVFFPLLLESIRKKRSREPAKVDGTPSSTASAPAKKGDLGDSQEMGPPPSPRGENLRFEIRFGEG